MAQEYTFKNPNDVVVSFAEGAAVGTARTNSQAHTLPIVTSYTPPSRAVPLEVKGQRSGTAVQETNQTLHRRDNQLFPFDVTFKGTNASIATACNVMFEDSAGVKALTGAYSFNGIYHGESTTNMTDVVFQNLNGDPTAADVQMMSCIGTSMTISQDIGTEGGDMMINLGLTTGYEPIVSDYGALSSVTDDANGTIYNINTMTEAGQGIDGQSLVITGWSITFNRTIERIGSYVAGDTTNYDPIAIGMSGAMEVTGSITCKADAETHDFENHFYDNSTCIINLQGAGFQFNLPTAKLEPFTYDTGGAAVMQTIPFRGLANSANSAHSIIDITHS
ncbi:MAG: hypothetical protein Unbinned2514contig1001_41 [Prokaryotic dsDNA virus sp.]|nr:MAG: hypothetical protein Unbinned2514contig1001_41 [Prokaryotic dsDNA virus sp.]|tara:strand:- start:8460 stop:9461 length:1002 start_codon:yes stop_codon:yes gene_type:complete